MKPKVMRPVEAREKQLGFPILNLKLDEVFLSKNKKKSCVWTHNLMILSQKS